MRPKSLYASVMVATIADFSTCANHSLRTQAKPKYRLKHASSPRGSSSVSFTSKTITRDIALSHLQFILSGSKSPASATTRWARPRELQDQRREGRLIGRVFAGLTILWLALCAALILQLSG